VKRRIFGIVFGAALCLFAVPRAKAQPSCLSVGATAVDSSGFQFYTVTNHCSTAIEGVFATKSGGSYSFGPLASGESSILQATATGPYRYYVCQFPRLSRISVNVGQWASWKLPGYGSDPSLVSCR
jgi:hypothetical protein